MSSLETERLTLHPLTMSQLALYLNKPGELGQELGIALDTTPRIGPIRRAIETKLTKMARADQSMHLWYTYWLIIATENGGPTGVGVCGFKGEPDEDGEVEIGYGVESDCRGKGYATETVGALIDWAVGRDTCRAVIAETLKSNIPSVRVLQKCGLTVYQETDTAFFWRTNSQPA